MLSLISGCVNTQKEPSKNLCYGAHLEYFYASATYTREEKEAKIATNDYVCKQCLDSLSHDEQLTCISE